MVKAGQVIVIPFIPSSPLDKISPSKLTFALKFADTQVGYLEFFVPELSTLQSKSKCEWAKQKKQLPFFHSEGHKTTQCSTRF